MDERANKKVVIDAGHGGNDPGAINGNIYEKDFALKVSKYIYDRLKQLGVPVYITRDTDETLNRDERVKRILNAFGNSKDVILLSNHINAGGGEGAEVVYALRNNEELASKILNEIGLSGQKMRKFYQKRYPTDSSKDYYFIHRLTGNIEPVLIEYGFIDNSNDLKKLQNNLLDYGEAVVKAVADYINVPYKKESLNTNEYTVKRGDTLYSIANKFGVSVPELKAANNLTSNLLTINQKLLIPTVPLPPQPNEYITYIVKKGDSLYNIAKQYDLTVNDLINYNQLPTTTLSIGQKILIPTPGNTANDDSNSDTNDNYYIVKNGDSLYSIAKKYNVSVNELKEINNLPSNLISIGQELILPIKSDKKTYYVKNGDTLYSIAKNYGVNVNELKSINNLKNDFLSIGQILIIP